MMSEDWMKGMNEDEYAEWQKQWQGSNCPFCGRFTKYIDCPDEAPDFCCKECFEAGELDD